MQWLIRCREITYSSQYQIVRPRIIPSEMQIFHLADRSDDPHSLVERGIGNFLTTLAVAMPDTNEKKSSKRIRRTMFVATIPPFLPCWFPRRVKLEIDVLKKKKRKNWRLKFHSFPAEENRWMAALIVPSRIFGYAPLRVCVWEAFVVHTNCVRLFASWPTYLGDTFPVYSRRVCVSYATPVEKRSGDSSSPPRCLAVHEQVFVANYTGDLSVLIN